MKKFLKTIIIGIFTVSIATGCVRFSNDTNDKQEKIFLKNFLIKSLVNGLGRKG